MAIAFRGLPSTWSFGESTYGASTATRGIRLPDGANLVIATDVFIDRLGTPYPDDVLPDEVVPALDTIPALDADSAVARALDWLRTMPMCRGGS